ncbi:hypothetical protein CEK28_08705 [Xenophilus sp. AP218F]|nr:hypothetical protein CEK28_08705 [Xenophilus sp. AP218F]
MLDELIATMPGMHPGGPERLPGGGRRLHKKGGGGGGAPAPDPRMGEAAMMNAQLGKDWLQFSREQFNIGNQRQAAIDALGNQVTQAQLDAMRANNQRGREADEFYKSTFQPMEKRMAEEAANYDSAEKQSQAAGEATAEASAQLALRKAAKDRAMTRMGVAPTSGRYQTASNSDAIDEALGTAAAANGARDKVRTMGVMLRKDAASFGRNMPGTAAASYGVGLNAGNSAVGNINAAQAAWSGNNNIMAQGFQGGISGHSAAGSIYGNQYGTQVQAYNAAQQAEAANGAAWGQGIGGLAMAGAVAY